MLIPRSSFQRLVREIVAGYFPDGRLQSSTLEALQEATEMYLVTMFEDAQMIALNGARKTLFVKDVRLWKQIGSYVK